MSAVTDRQSPEDIRVIARIIAAVRQRMAAERDHRGDATADHEGDHDDTR